MRGRESLEGVRPHDTAKETLERPAPPPPPTLILYQHGPGVCNHVNVTQGSAGIKSERAFYFENS